MKDGDKMLYKPYSYQEKGLKFMLNNRYNALFWQMGGGKTVVSLTALSILLKDRKVNKALVVAPLKVADHTWPTEIKKWDHLKHLKFSKLVGTAEQRKEALSAEAQIYIINIDNLGWLYNNMPNKKLFDYIILDELSLYKNKDTKRFKAIMQLRPYARGITGLTGTPAPNSLLDLWAPICILDLGERFDSFARYRKEHFAYLPRFANTDSNSEIKDSTPGKYKIKKGHEKAIYDKLKNLALTISAEDFIKMPEKKNSYITIELSDEEYKKYSDMAVKAVVTIADKEVKIKDKIAVVGKLMQMANGRVYGPDKEVLLVHNQKLIKLKEIIDSSFGRPVLVLSNFICDSEAVVQNIPGAEKLAHINQIEQWNAGKIPVLVANPKSCGHGLNLQGGGSIIIWYSLTWSLELYLQANARLYRQGQQAEQVVINHLCAESTIDDMVLEVLAGKYKGQESLLEALKEKFKNRY